MPIIHSLPTYVWGLVSCLFGTCKGVLIRHSETMWLLVYCSKTQWLDEAICTVQAKAKAEQAQIMMHNTSDSCTRQLAQISTELRLVRQQAQLLQGQLETALGQLEQKRTKKRHYKAVLMKETEQLQAALVHKDVRIGELNRRIDKVRHTCSRKHKMTLHL